MKEISLINSVLSELTEENLITLCQLNNFKPNELTELELDGNNIADLNCFKENTLFINIKKLSLSYNINLMDINSVKYLVNLEYLNINNLNLKNEYETIVMLKTLNKLKTLCCYDTFNNYTEIKLQTELSNIKYIYK